MDDNNKDDNNKSDKVTNSGNNNLTPKLTSNSMLLRRIAFDNGTKSLPKSFDNDHDHHRKQTMTCDKMIQLFSTPNSSTKKAGMKYDPKCATGIPFIPSKPVTKCVPFRLSERKTTPKTARTLATAQTPPQTSVNSPKTSQTPKTPQLRTLKK